MFIKLTERSLLLPIIVSADVIADVSPSYENGQVVGSIVFYKMQNADGSLMGRPVKETVEEIWKKLRWKR